MNLKKLFYKSGSITGYILGLVGSIVTILAVNGTITIGLRWLVVFAICEIFIITVAVLSFINYKRIQNEASRFEVDSYEPSDGKDFFYIHFSKLFRYQALVSIYVTINDISKRMGFGVVSNVSENQYIEIEVVKIFSFSLYLRRLESRIRNGALVQTRVVVLIFGREVGLKQQGYVKELGIERRHL